MRLILAAVSSILASMPSFFRVPDTPLFAPGKGKASPQPYRPSGVRAARCRATKRRNQARARK